VNSHAQKIAREFGIKIDSTVSDSVFFLRASVSYYKGRRFLN